MLGVFPSDHVIGDEPRFLKALQKGIQVAAAGDNMVVLGIEPVRAETGYGYIETGDLTRDDSALHVRRFTEKPNQNRAEDFVAAGNYYWNSGMFLWSARTLANAVREHLPETAPLLESIAAAYGTPEFEQVFHSLYGKCENISVDYAIMEPATRAGATTCGLVWRWVTKGRTTPRPMDDPESRESSRTRGRTVATEPVGISEAGSGYVVRAPP